MRAKRVTSTIHSHPRPSAVSFQISAPCVQCLNIDHFARPPHLCFICVNLWLTAFSCLRALRALRGCLAACQLHSALSSCHLCGPNLCSAVLYLKIDHFCEDSQKLILASLHLIGVHLRASAVSPVVLGHTALFAKIVCSSCGMPFLRYWLLRQRRQKV